MMADMEVDKVAEMMANMVADKKNPKKSLTRLAHLLSFASLFPLQNLAFLREGIKKKQSRHLSDNVFFPLSFRQQIIC